MPNSAGGAWLDELAVGASARSARIVTEADILAFAAASGDMNPVHFDEDYAATTRFGTRIAHGMLTAAHISALIGMRLPGPGSVYVSQSLNFRRPVKIGDSVTTTVEITAIDPDKGFVTLSTSCCVAGKAVVNGEAVVLVARQIPA
ncbi:MAG: MaoC family dehydratase [Hyphomonadaceae bacterium]|jgi:3-hydroxybutyryl-CoA dehydratase|nr:MaoC family dehydratase [Hyphomonadaceae bacterium]